MTKHIKKIEKYEEKRRRLKNLREQATAQQMSEQNLNTFWRRDRQEWDTVIENEKPSKQYEFNFPERKENYDDSSLEEEVRQIELDEQHSYQQYFTVCVGPKFKKHFFLLPEGSGK